MQAALDAALPPGLDVVEVVPATPGALADLLTGSRWAVDLVGVDPQVVEQAVDALLARPSVTVQRMTKNGLRDVDARAAVVDLTLGPGSAPDTLRLLVTLEHLVPAVRPDDVLAALVTVHPEAAPAEAPVLTRLAQGVLDRQSGTISEP